MSGQTRLTHLLCGNRGFYGEAESRSVGPSGQISERRGIVGGPHVPGSHERCHRFGRHYPWRDAGQEVLGEEWSERLIFPGLQVARGPVVEEAITGYAV